MATVGDRIRDFRIKKGYTLDLLAKKIGSSRQNLYKYETSIITNIPYDKIISLAKALDVQPWEIMGWDAPKDNFSKANDLILTIPFISQKLSAGVGIEHLSDADMDIKQIDILAEMARGVDKNSLVAARVKGDSMIDEHINSGDIAIFSRGLVNGEGIYVINYFGDVLIKRISYDPKTNTVSIISANRNYPTKTADAEDVLVLGKVVGVFHIMDI